MRLLTAAAALVLMSAAYGQGLPTMPPDLQARWQSSLQADEGWNDRGFEGIWSPVVRDLPARYPEWVEPERQMLCSYMWYPGGAHTNQPVYFRRTVWLPGQVEAGLLDLTADDEFQLYVNGRGIGRSAKAYENVTFDITSYLQPGANVIAVQARNLKPPGYGLLVIPEITQSFPMSDASAWRTATSAGSGWQAPSFDDRGWAAAVPDPAPPIKLESLEPFACIAIAGGMQDFSTAYFRRTLELDGMPLDASLVILSDDSYELYVNGTLLAVEKRVNKSYLPRRVGLTRYLLPGKNTLAVKVTNDWGPGRLYCVPTVTMTF